MSCGKQIDRLARDNVGKTKGRRVRVGNKNTYVYISLIFVLIYVITFFNAWWPLGPFLG